MELQGKNKNKKKTGNVEEIRKVKEKGIRLTPLQKKKKRIKRQRWNLRTVEMLIIIMLKIGMLRG